MSPSRPHFLLACLAAFFVGLVRPSAACSQETAPGAPYVPTPMNAVEEMLQLADVSRSDTVYDLGSGDGRLPVTAARLYGAQGVGVEIQPDLVSRARKNAAAARVDSLVRFIQGDLFETDLRSATVVTLYLFPEMNRKLRSKLLRQLEPGDRIVAHDFDMGEWQPDSVVRVPGREGASTRSLDDVPPVEGREQEAVFDSVVAALRSPEDGDSNIPGTEPIRGPAELYRWVVPADVGGTWTVSLPEGRTARMRLDQRYREVRVNSTAGAAEADTVQVQGTEVRITLLGADGASLVLGGTVTGDRIQGRTPDGARWSARRVEDTDTSILEWEGGGAPPSSP